MTNLLRETRQAICESGHTPADIAFIGSRDTGHRCTWEEFEVLADREYDDGYGGAEVAEDLEVVFADGSWLERGEYDGAEWWEERRPFVEPGESAPIASLFQKGHGLLGKLSGIAKGKA